MGSSILSPRSIAVIGATDKVGSVGHAITSNIIKDFKGLVFPINPTKDFVLGVKTFKSVMDVPHEVELAVIVTKNTIVPKILEECGIKKVGGVIIITAGFKETGKEGIKLEDEVRTIAQRYGIRVIGPNCLGVMNLDPDVMMNATFLKRIPKPGNIALVSQSGAICAALVEDASAKDLGFSAVVSMGNKMDQTEVEILEILSSHQQTKVIVMYLEDMRDGHKFINICKQITKHNSIKKPVLVLKSGRSARGAKAAMSHTGALMGSDVVYDTVLRQAGAIRVDTMEELFDYAAAFAKQPMLSKGDLLIISNAGGPAIISTDICEKFGLRMADISDIRPRIDALIPPWGSSRNPVDIVGDADHERFKNVLDVVLAHPNVGSVVTMCTPSATLDYDKLAEVIVAMSKKYDKTMIASLMGQDEGLRNKQILANGCIPYYNYSEEAIRSLNAVLQFAEWLKLPEGVIANYDANKNEVQELLRRVKDEGRSTLLQEEGMEVLNYYGLPIPLGKIAKTEDEAEMIAKELGYPVVMKISSPQMSHKSDAGGVRVNIKNGEEARDAFVQITKNVKLSNPDAEISGILVQEMVMGGKEMIIGSKQEPGFGAVLMFGMGGIYVQFLGDMVFRVAPVTDMETSRMINSIRTSQILHGVRGEKPYDTKKLAECIQRISQLVTDFPQIKELDLNPTVVFEEGKGCKVVDVRMGL
ncbi:acetate--CoA ligase family protein [Candidatus Nitrosocosmicus arcticus]|uniref:Acetyl-CoA synthetase (ADP-forming)/ 4-hydroxybutyryl-CoA synthetase n=1 Tax=Candidatus Nitrosocosmicus arcticus TaxID=2035267 RepID=A0A557SSW6_9ARCH|nr:acetate--CoA ligase [Candidatus Nitrosocosmicus arcticus]TVP39678.1 acetyl-CoA synthetase (ADP-forming)/ 4-hydroxybutyryl-CoA synthetase [Candidatus Nitrosocosmicus arcticus]